MPVVKAIPLAPQGSAVAARTIPTPPRIQAQTARPVPSLGGVVSSTGLAF